MTDFSNLTQLVQQFDNAGHSRKEFEYYYKYANAVKQIKELNDMLHIAESKSVNSTQQVIQLEDEVKKLLHKVKIHDEGIKGVTNSKNLINQIDELTEKFDAQEKNCTQRIVTLANKSKQLNDELTSLKLENESLKTSKVDNTTLIDDSKIEQEKWKQYNLRSVGKRADRRFTMADWINYLEIVKLKCCALAGGNDKFLFVSVYFTQAIISINDHLIISYGDTIGKILDGANGNEWDISKIIIQKFDPQDGIYEYMYELINLILDGMSFNSALMFESEIEGKMIKSNKKVTVLGMSPADAIGKVIDYVVYPCITSTSQIMKDAEVVKSKVILLKGLVVCK